MPACGPAALPPGIVGAGGSKNDLLAPERGRGSPGDPRDPMENLHRTPWIFLHGDLEQLFGPSEKSIGIHMLFGARRDPPIPLETLFGFGFGSWVSHLMVPELEQRRSGAQGGSKCDFAHFVQK